MHLNITVSYYQNCTFFLCANFQILKKSSQFWLILSQLRSYLLAPVAKFFRANIQIRKFFEPKKMKIMGFLFFSNSVQFFCQKISSEFFQGVRP